MEATERLSVPGPGRTVSAAVEDRAVHVRKAVHLLEPELRSLDAETNFNRLFASRWEGGHASPADEPTSLRAAWALVNTWLLARMTRSVAPNASFLDAEAWFIGGREVLPSLAEYAPANIASQAIWSLSRLSLDDDLLELLPYVLEQHGPGSRLSVMRDPTTRTAREAKRRGGIFYTAADVAEYMACGVMAGRKSLAQLRCLDPSCGTGVFFAALLRQAFCGDADGEPLDRLDYATRSLYGFDVSPLAIESSAFVLLHYCFADAKARRISPWSAWHALRLNLAGTDSLRLRAVSSEGTYADAARNRQTIRGRLLDPAGGEVQPLIEMLPTETAPQPTLFGLSSLRNPRCRLWAFSSPKWKEGSTS